MPVRDLSGGPVPAGKVSRELVYDGITEEGSPDWMQRIGDVTETKSSIVDGRGELSLGVDVGDVGGYAFPPFDPDSFREVRLLAAVRASELSEGASVALGVADVQGTEAPTGWAYYREGGTASTRGRLSFGTDSVESVSNGVAISLDNRTSCGLLEVSVRPFERAVTVSVGGADRGDVAFEDDDLPIGFGEPTFPKLLLDATESESDKATVASNEARECLSISKARVTYVHD